MLYLRKLNISLILNKCLLIEDFDVFYLWNKEDLKAVYNKRYNRRTLYGLHLFASLAYFK